ncbi:hypothetical protein SLA2020_330890 [Shorea laevis]
MILTLLRRGPVVNRHSLLRVCCFCSRACNIIGKEGNREVASTNYSSRIHLSPLFSDSTHQLARYDIEVVDNDTWQVSSGLAHNWRGFDTEIKSTSFTQQVDQKVEYDSPVTVGDPDFDEIDNMRIHGNLFYKIDRGSKEFEEYSYDFHRRKTSKKMDDQKGSEKKESLKKKDDPKGSKKKEKIGTKSASGGEKPLKVVKNGSDTDIIGKVENSNIGEKKVRTPTFNQLTGPYHEPFCLDIYISKASVRACIVHRATSKVVTVAHSISKDMKFDLASTRNAAACATVGKILAQRALADDIHDVIYTPRKGEKLEGKLQIVLQSIIDNGVNVKVKLKQRRPKKASQASIS